MLNHGTFPMLQVSKLCSLFSNNCGGEFWYSDMTNIWRPNFKSSILKPIQFYPTPWRNEAITQQVWPKETFSNLYRIYITSKIYVS